MTTATALCLAFLIERRGSDDARVLLGRKLQGFGAGRLVAPGGHVEPGETSRQAAERELYEETGLRVAMVRDAGRVDLHFPGRPDWEMTVDVFTAADWSGDLTPCAELEPQWHDVGRIPWPLLWDDSRMWVPPVLRGATVHADVTYDEAGAWVAHADLRVS